VFQGQILSGTWLTRDIFKTGSFRMSQVVRQLRSGTINDALLTLGYLLALLRELLQCLRALTEITKPRQVRKMNLTRILYQFKKRVGKSILTFRT